MASQLFPQHPACKADRVQAEVDTAPADQQKPGRQLLPSYDNSLVCDPSTIYLVVPTASQWVTVLQRLQGFAAILCFGILNLFLVHEL